jgi:uncharacterized protein YlaI
MLFAITLLLALAMAAFVSAPLLASDATGLSTLPVDITPQGDLKRRRLVLYENLQDLDFEFQSGKISQNDYEALRQSYLAEAAELMMTAKELQKLGEEDAVIEREVAARRAQRRARMIEEYVCPKCGYENPVPVKFCGECGSSIAKKAQRA